MATLSSGTLKFLHHGTKTFKLGFGFRLKNYIFKINILRLMYPLQMKL